MHTPDTTQANDYQDKGHPAGNQEFRDNNYTKKKIPQKRIAKNPTQKSDLSSQKMHACNAKQYKQIKRRMVKKQNQQEVKLEQKDQDVVRFVTEVERLQRTIHTCTFELRETQRKVKKHCRYIRAIHKTDQMLQAENVALKGLVSGLSDLRKENEQQKRRIQELAYHCKNWGNIVAMLKEAEARNESLRRMVQIEESSTPGLICNFGMFSPSRFRATGNFGSPTSTLGSHYNHTKLLNPGGGVFSPSKLQATAISDHQRELWGEAYLEGYKAE